MSRLLFSYEGPIGARGFWLGLLGVLSSTILLSVAVGVVLGIGLVVTGADRQTQEWASFAGAAVVMLYAVYTQMAVTVKRCRARGRSAWWSLLSLVPFVGLVWLALDLGLDHPPAEAPKPGA